jgi:hypothetical protein
MELWELIARERIRDTLANYTWSGDSGRITELTETFAPDCVLEIRKGPRVEGRQAIVDYLGGVVATPSAVPGVRKLVRHSIANIRFTSITPVEAHVESYFTVVTEIGLDHCGRYRDTFVPIGDEWLLAHRNVSTTWRSPDSAMAGPDSI